MMYMSAPFISHSSQGTEWALIWVFHNLDHQRAIDLVVLELFACAIQYSQLDTYYASQALLRTTFQPPLLSLRRHASSCISHSITLHNISLTYHRLNHNIRIDKLKASSFLEIMDAIVVLPLLWSTIYGSMVGWTSSHSHSSSEQWIARWISTNSCIHTSKVHSEKYLTPLAFYLSNFPG